MPSSTRARASAARRASRRGPRSSRRSPASTPAAFALENAGRTVALRRRADRLGRQGARGSADHVSVLGRRRAHPSLLAHPCVDRRGGARRRRGRRPRSRALRDPAATQPRGGGSRGGRGAPRSARPRAGRPAGGALARRRFNETVAKLSRLLRSQGEFVADASHELRTPLTALRLRLESLPPSRDRDAALHEADRLRDLVDGLLTLARADAGAEGSARVDAAALMRERVDVWLPLADEHGSLSHATSTARCRCAPRRDDSRRFSTTSSPTRSRHLPKAGR